MRVAEFAYELPESLIAQRPAPDRRDSRLLALDGSGGEPRDLRFPDLLELLHPGDLLVLNDTRVVAARLAGVRPTGGRVEVLLERPLGPRRCLAQARASKRLREGAEIRFGSAVARVAGRREGLYVLELVEGEDFAALMAAEGAVPLPPYIRRAPEPGDGARYQTVYAREDGAVAAPTAGLHFDDEFLRALEAKGVQRAFVTLHVGAGTFQPVRVEHTQDHRMHAERVRVPEAVCRRVTEVRAAGGRVVAVGTTAVRALESAAAGGALRPFDDETRLFIWPGYRFRCVDALVTNFHLPESTLLMLVCAFAGTEAVLAAYRHAVAERYRFFSYGDAMFLTRSP
jgi:S-adenosylmethionine:tRNA ribosyltransferase-isomerase